MVSYYLISSEDLAPTIEELQNQLSLGTEGESISCLNELIREYSDKEILVKYSFDNATFSSSINSREVNLQANFLVSINDKNNSYTLKNFEVFYTSEFLQLYQVALEINAEQKKHLNSFCITCYDSITSKYDIQIKTIETEVEGEYIVIYYLYKIDQNSLSDPFVFAHKLYLNKQ